MNIGFSTGSIAFGDVDRGLDVAVHEHTNAVELSALREDELDPLIDSLSRYQDLLRHFSYVSFHAPSRRVRFSEQELVAKLQPIAARGWAIIIHPDIIEDFSQWRDLGAAVCIENMDKRKRDGRTVEQLKRIFAQLPEATFCFDIGHAQQVDPTMHEARLFLRTFGSRLRQIHMSYVNSQCRHERLNYVSVAAYRRVSHLISNHVPVILETPVSKNDIDHELSAAKRVFSSVAIGILDEGSRMECFERHRSQMD